MTLKMNNIKGVTGFGKQLMRGAALLLLACLIAMTSIGVALAAGGVNHKVKVNNGTPGAYYLYLEAYDGTLYGPKEILYGDNYSFKTGAKCPDRIYVELHKGVSDNTASVCTKDGSSHSNCKKLDCRSSTWKVTRDANGKLKIRED